MAQIKIKSTTVLAVYHKGQMALGADGQATMGATVAKSHVKKIRKLAEGTIITGFAVLRPMPSPYWIDLMKS